MAFVYRTMGLPKSAMADLFHFGAYALWMWLLAGLAAGGYVRALERRRLAMLVVALAAMSVSQEGLQFLNPTRQPSLFDVGLNLAGGLGLLIARPLLTLRRSSSPASLSG